MNNVNTRETNIRIAQLKSKSGVTITLPIEETGIYPGDGVIFKVIGEGKVLLTRIRKEELEKDVGLSYINKLLNMFGLHTKYELKRKNEIKSTNLDEQVLNSFNELEIRRANV